MEHELLQHEKIRFRRDEITDLGSYPSALGNDIPLTRSRPRFSVLRRALSILVGGSLVVAILVLVAVFAVGVLGMGTDRLRLEAEKALKEFAGAEMAASVGPADIRFDLKRLLALEVRDVSLKRADNGERIVDAGLVRFGIQLLPLFAGDIRLSDAQLSNARIVTSAMPSRGSDWAAALRNEEGLIDPDKASIELFGAVHGALDALESTATGQIALDDVEFAFPTGDIASVRIVDATLARGDEGGLVFAADMSIDGRPAKVTAEAARDAAARRITTLTVSAEAAEPADAGGEVAAESVEPVTTGTQSGEAHHRVGAASLTLSGVEGEGETPSRIDLSLSLANSTIDLGARGLLSGNVDIGGAIVAGSNRIAVDRLRASVGRSTFDFRGAIGPRPATGQPGDKPAYRFELISAKSTVAPETSPEPALETYIRAAGVYVPAEDRLVADEIVLKSGPGETLGTAALQFAEGAVPGIAVAFAIHDMPVPQVKQLWPWFSARNARQWVLDHLFGGRVVEGRIQFKVAPGRLGNGIPLNGDEVSGRFEIEDTRFDTAGLIPPIRDAVGAVEFRGNDVDVSLASGVMFMPSGRSVAASNGRMTVTKANVPPVIGDLDIDVAGEAAAIAELASFDPINAMRFIGLAPDDFSGQMSGHVKADIPLQKGIETERLRWNVALNYEDLAVAKPVDGQMVTEAVGTIVVTPEKAVVSAKGKLTGVPSEIEAVEPLRDKTVERQRKVRMVLDDKLRDKLVPGISDLVSGTVKLDLDALGQGRRKLTADLTAAELRIPWAGWSKGPGIAAQADFILEQKDGNATLSDFSLSGQSFGIEGTLALTDGSLSQGRFSKVRLNRGDEVSVVVKRAGKGYSVDVSGAALDARSLIKQFTSDTSTATKATGTGSVKVNVDLKSVTGFHGEQLSNFKLDYSGAGNRVIGLDVTANAKSGAAISIRNGSEGGGRTMRMESPDAGAILRFLDIYEHMEGGSISLSLKGGAEGPMSGQVDARDFWVVNEPKLGSIVSTRAAGEMSLNEAVKRDIDTSRVKFERGFTQIEKGDGYLKLSNGVLRGPLIGATFQGTLYDKTGNMDMTGTFMPAYGLNRIFGEIPLIGAILGNGRDRGLIGVTFKLEGDADKPELRINPLSAIAPGIFRSIFEFR